MFADVVVLVVAVAHTSRSTHQCLVARQERLGNTNPHRAVRSMINRMWH